jgi:hypothetical protein
MKKLAHISLFALTMLSVLPAASAEPETTECTSNEPAHVAEGTAVNEGGDERAEAERRAIETATELCQRNADGSPVFIEINTRQSGAVATSTARFFCSESC